MNSVSAKFRKLCKICPFECGVDRVKQFGVCGLPNKILVSHVQQHFFEEPFISGECCERGCGSCGDGADLKGGSCGGGSGTIFFTGCNGKCVFCQNYKISQEEEWKKARPCEFDDAGLFEICSDLIEKRGVHNINLVSPTPYSDLLCEFLKKYKKKISVPVIWNSNGYEKAETIRTLSGLVDVYLPDLKYFDDDLAVKFSSMPNYFKFASGALKEMKKQVGWPEIGEDGFIRKGLVIRHLVLPGYGENSKKVLKWIRDEFGKEAYVALMSQYYPTYKACKIAEISRKLNQDEHEEIINYFENLGFEDGLTQDLESADEIYTPDF